jgi:hypothetical protein
MASPLLLILSLGLVTLTASSGAVRKSHDTECDVKGIFKTIDVPSGSISLSGTGEIQDVDQLLGPISLSSGTYDISVTRKAKDLYRADGTGTYILTRYCYEYVYSQKAELRYSAFGVVGTGKLTFRN